MKYYWVYIITNKRNGALYTGVTSNLEARIWQHKNSFFQGFSQRYQLHRLVYYETHEDIYEAIYREKTIKKWPRTWKLNLIEKLNPHWDDLCNEIMNIDVSL